MAGGQTVVVSRRRSRRSPSARGNRPGNDAASLLAEALGELDGLARPWAASAAFDRIVEDLVDLDGLGPAGDHRAERELSRQLLLVVAGLWERGWQPVEVHHVVRRSGDRRALRLLVAVIAAEPAGCGAAGPLPPRWRQQLQALGIDPPERPPGPPGPPAGGPAGATEGDGPEGDGPAGDAVVLRWRAAERVEITDSLEVALRVLAQLRALPGLSRIVEPPSRWGAAAATGPGPALPGEPKHHATIRALLAKAESTPYPAEAEAFSAKAQELMIRHAVDDAVLAAGAGPGPATAVRAQRLAVEQPFGAEKVQLLAVVAELNGVEVVWDDEWALATLVGFAGDLDLVEALFASLLVQAMRAMDQAVAEASHRRAPAFRRAFLLAYGSRIGQRLDVARVRVGREALAHHGAALVPVLAERREAVRRVAEQLFPDSGPMRTRMVDAEGWDAGHRAAAAATLAAPSDPPDGAGPGPAGTPARRR